MSNAILGPGEFLTLKFGFGPFLASQHQIQVLVVHVLYVQYSTVQYCTAVVRTVKGMDLVIDMQRVCRLGQLYQLENNRRQYSEIFIFSAPDRPST